MLRRIAPFSMLFSLLIALPALLLCGAASPSGNSLVFSGTSQLYLDRFIYSEDSSAGVFLNNSCTFEMWVYPSHQPAHSSSILLQSGIISSHIPKSLRLWYEHDRKALKLEVWTLLSEEWYVQPIISTVSVEPGVWTHIAVSPSDYASHSLYINGVPSSAITSSPFPVSLPPPCHFSIGNNFTGYIDEVRIWNYERRADEIRGAMSTSFCNATDELVLHLTFDQPLFGEGAEDSVVVDLSDSSACGRMVPSDCNYCVIKGGTGAEGFGEKYPVPFWLGEDTTSFSGCHNNHNHNTDNNNNNHHYTKRDIIPSWSDRRSPLAYGPPSPAGACHRRHHESADAQCPYPTTHKIDPEPTPRPNVPDEQPLSTAIPLYYYAGLAAFLVTLGVCMICCRYVARIRKAQNASTAYQPVPHSISIEQDVGQATLYPAIFIDTERGDIHTIPTQLQPASSQTFHTPPTYSPVSYVYYMPQQDE